MIEIYIEGNKLDISNDIEVTLTFDIMNVENPTTIRNAYSKSITVKGTPNNNAIFSNYHKLDFNGDFNPKTRLNAVICNDGDVIHNGYIQLNSIKKTNNDVSYTFTFFGNTGDFFYNLSYDSEGNEKTLADLYFGFEDSKGDIMTEAQEATATIAQWDADWITQSWNIIQDSRDKSDHRPIQWITAAPTYSGLYEEFDNDTFLVNTNNDGGVPTRGDTTFPKDVSALFDFKGSGYDSSFGWFKVKAGREMTEWECKDLRANQQRPCISSMLLIDAICNPKNNGGYNVVLDKDVFGTEYLYDSYVMLNKIDFADSDKVEAEIDLGWQTPQQYITIKSPLATNSWNTNKYLYSGTSRTFNTTNLKKPRAKFEFIPEIKINNHASSLDYPYAALSFMDMTQNGVPIYIGGYGIKVQLMHSNNVK